MRATRLAGLARLFDEELGHIGVLIDAHLGDHVDEVEDGSDVYVQLVGIVNLEYVI